MSSSSKTTPPVATHQLLLKALPYFGPHVFLLALGMATAMLVGALDAVMPLGIKLYLELFIEKTGLAVLSSPLPAALSFAQPVLSWLSTTLQAGGSWLIPLGIISFTLLQGLLAYLSLYLNTKVANEITAQVKTDLYARLLSFETAYFDTTDSGGILFSLSHDVDLACSNLILYIKQTLTRTFSVLTLAITLLTLSWKLAIVALVVLGSTLIPLTFTRRYLRNLSHSEMAAAGNVGTHFLETCQGNRTIAAYNLGQRQQQGLQRILDMLVTMAIKLARVQGLITPLMHTIAGVGVGLVLWYGTYLIQGGELGLGSFAAFLTSLILLYTPIKTLGNMSVNLQMAMLALERVFKLMERPSQMQEASRPIPLEGLGTGITFQEVSFRYQPSLPKVLDSINLTIQPGQTVALVGPSGSGKTTLVHLLLRLYDVSEGAIFINGQNIRQCRTEQLRQQMAAVFQDNFIFRGSLRDNILLGKANATEAEIEAAVKAAYLDAFIAELPLGLDTQVGERGLSLSGGQKQRLAIARALIKDAPLVLLDEATSALDNQSEAVVQKALDSLMTNRTVLVIAHRLSTVRNADTIVVLHQGQIKEQGSHEALLQQQGLYAALYHAQFKPQGKQEEKEASATTLLSSPAALEHSLKASPG